jgi:hypothetical protein
VSGTHAWHDTTLTAFSQGLHGERTPAVENAAKMCADGEDEAVNLLHRRADRDELVAEEHAARVGHDGHDGERDAGGYEAIFDRGGGTLVGKKRPEQNHRQLLFIRSNVGSRRYQTGKVIDEAFARVKRQVRPTLP